LDLGETAEHANNETCSPGNICYVVSGLDASDQKPEAAIKEKYKCENDQVTPSYLTSRECIPYAKTKRKT
jgi:hypothetical protein